MIYICLDVCKKGFNYGCRPIICLDACHLKVKFERHLMCAIGKYDNDNMFPITFEMVEGENKDS